MDLGTGKGTGGIAVWPGSSELWVTNRGEDTLAVIDTKAETTTQRIPPVAFPIRVQFTVHWPLALMTNAKSGPLRSLGPHRHRHRPQRKRAYVAHANLDSISVIDLDTFKIVDQFQAGKEPDGMAYSRRSVNRSNEQDSQPSVLSSQLSLSGLNRSQTSSPREPRYFESL